MLKQVLSRTAREPIAVVAVTLTALGGGTAIAAATIDGSDVRNNSLTGADIRDVRSGDIADGTIACRDVTRSIRLKLCTDQRSTAGVPGPKGDKGDAGATGAKGDAGATGATGAQGLAGEDAAYAVSSLVPFADDESTAPNNEWRSYNAGSAAGGATPAIDANGIAFGEFADGNDWASVYTYALKGVALENVGELAYSEQFTGGSGPGAAPYVILTMAGGDTVTFNPNTQPVTPTAGAWQRWALTEGTVRWNDTPGNNPDITWVQLLADHGDAQIDYVSVQAGNTGASDGSTSHVRQVTLKANGAIGEFPNYTFG